MRKGPRKLFGEIASCFNMTNFDTLSVWDAVVKPGTPPNIVAIRDIEQHSERRKLWNHAFTTASLKELQVIVESRVLELVEELRKRISPKLGAEIVSVDLAQWMTNLS